MQATAERRCRLIIVSSPRRKTAALLLCTFVMHTLVSRFRSSHHCAAHSLANFGIDGTLALYDSTAGLGFAVPTQPRGYNNRNFKSTALALALTSLTMGNMQAAELTILAGGGITGPMRELGPRFE